MRPEFIYDAQDGFDLTSERECTKRIHEDGHSTRAVLGILTFNSLDSANIALKVICVWMLFRKSDFCVRV